MEKDVRYGSLTVISVSFQSGPFAPNVICDYCVECTVE